MAIAMTISDYLADHDVSYDVLTHSYTLTSSESAQASHVPGSRLAKSVVVEDEDGYLLVVLPADRRVDFGELRRLLHRNLGLATERELVRLFRDCELGALPAIGPAYGIETLVDDAIAEQSEVYFEAGDHEQLIRVTHEGFNTLMGEGIHHGHFSHQPK